MNHLSTLLFSRDTHRIWAVYTVVVIAIATACFGSLRHHLLDIHDEEIFRDHIAVSRDFSHFFSAEKELATGRPVAELVRYLGYLIWGNDPAWMHLYVASIHALASLLLAIACHRMGMPLELSLGSGLLFLLNTAHFQAVHMISCLDYPLAAVWVLTALICHSCLGEDKGRLWGVGFVASLLLAVLSHIASVMIFPFLLYRAWASGKIGEEWRSLLLAGVAVLPAMLFAVATTEQESTLWKSIDGMGMGGEGGEGETALGGGRLLLWLLSRLLTTAHWLPIPYYEFREWEVWVGGAVLLALAILIGKRREVGASWGVWIVVFLLPFLPVPRYLLLHLPSSPSRYLYLASVGSSVLVGWLIWVGSRRFDRWGRPLYIFCLSLLLLSGFRSLKRTELLSIYSSGRSYMAEGNFDLGIDRMRLAIRRGRGTVDLEDAYTRLCVTLAFLGREDLESSVDEGLRLFPQSRTLTVYRLAIDSLEGEKGEQADRELEELLSAEADVVEVVVRCYNNLGRGYLERKEYARAAAAYERLVRFSPDEARGFKGLGIAWVHMGEGERAVDAFDEALRLEPGDVWTMNIAALALYQLNRPEEAVSRLEEAVRLSPENAKLRSSMYRTLIQLYEEGGREEKEIALYRSILHRDLPGVGNALYSQAGRFFMARGSREDAIRAYRRALSIEAEDVVTRVNLGWCLYEEGEYAAAIQEYRRALDSGPNSVAQFNLGLALLARGDVEEANLEYGRGVEQFGAEEGRRIGAVDDLKSLIGREIQAASVRKILAEHWHE